MISKLKRADNPVHTRKAADLLKKGGVIIHPTETIYGFTASALQGNAVRRVDRIKGRKSGETYLLLVRDIKMAQELHVLFDRTAAKLAARFWPGPLTLVLPVEKKSLLFSLSRNGTIALRVSSEKSIRDLFELIDFPLISTSVNRSGEEPLRIPEKMESLFAKEVDLILEKGVLPSRKSSTLVAIKNETIDILRPGPITEQELYGA